MTTRPQIGEKRLENKMLGRKVSHLLKNFLVDSNKESVICCNGVQTGRGNETTVKRKFRKNEEDINSRSHMLVCDPQCIHPLIT